MASIRPLNGKFFVQICVNGNRASKVLPTKKDAIKWAKDEEHRIRSMIPKSISDKGTRGEIRSYKVRAATSLESILSASVPIKKVVGIYFLIKDNVIVYIGQSKNIQARLGSHLFSDKDFDRYAFIKVNEKDLTGEEIAYIKKFKPELNISHNKEYEVDNGETY